MVEKHIKSLLYNHDCVIIPEFGGLITRYVSARINPVKHTLVPPSRKIAFNEKLVLNDGLLISTIAYANNISSEEAKQLVMNFVHQARTRLNGDNRFELADIGVFRYNAERKLEFEYLEADNLLEASFGLPEIVARPVRREDPAVLRTLIKERHAEPETTKQPLRRRLKRVYNVAAGLALTGLVGAGLYMLSLQTDYTISSLSPTSLFNNDNQAEDGRNQANYASDNASVTADERATAYDDMLPGIANEAGDGSDEISEVTTSETSLAGETLGESTQYAASQDVTTSSVAPEVEASPVAAEAKAPVTTISGKDGRFYVISGGYARMNNAEFSRQEIAEQGHEAKVLEPGRGGKLFKVSIADFATSEEALAAMRNYRKSFGETIWVYNN